MKASAIAIVIALLIPASALAADQDTLTPGARVRLTSTASPGARVQGIVHALDGTTLTIINDDHQMLKVSRAQLTKVEMGWGRRRSARKGFVIGALVGLSMGLLVAVMPEDGSCYRSNCAPLTSGEKVAVALISPAVYGAMGAGIGALIKTDRWVEVPLDTVRVTAGPMRGGGVGASVSFRF